MTFPKWCGWSVALSLLVNSVAVAQVPPPVYVAPPPVYVAPPGYVPPPPGYPPPRPYYASPPPRPYYYVAPPPRRHYYRRWGAGRALSTVGALLLAFGIFAVIGGGVVLIVAEADQKNDPCTGCFPVSYGLLGGGAWGVASGITLLILGKILSIDGAYSLRSLPVVPTLALAPSLNGGAPSGFAGLGFNF